MSIPTGWGKLLQFLYQAADWIADEKHEVLLVIDPQSGRILHREDGGPEEVQVNPELTEGRVVMHNHPAEFTFSGDDIAVTAEQKAWLAVVVTQEHLYFLEQPESGWPPVGGIYLDSVLLGMDAGPGVNTDNQVREETIRNLAASTGAYYWSQNRWRVNMRLFREDSGQSR